MLLGYTTDSFPDHNLAMAIRLLQDIGYRAISIRLDAKSFDPRASNVRFADQVEAIVSEIDETTHIILDTDARFLLDPRQSDGPTLADVSDKIAADRIDLIKQSIEAAKRLNNATVTFSSGCHHVNEDVGQVLERLASRVDLLMQVFAESSTPIAIRPSKSHVISSIATFERLLQWLTRSESLNLVADVAVMSQNGELPVIPKLLRHVASLRAVFLGNGHGVDRLVVANGLKQAGFNGPLILSGHRFEDDPVSTAISEFDQFQRRAC